MQALLAEAFESYRAFAPPDWVPPTDSVESIRERFVAERGWALIAERMDGSAAGHVAFLPQALDHDREPIPGTAHFMHLFLRPEWWGTGLAARLHDAALAEMRRRGIARARLFTPAGQMRARAFYARMGWTQPGEPIDDPRFGMPIVELWCGL